MIGRRNTAKGLELRSSLPGRQRWHVAAVYRNAGLAVRLAAQLEADPRVRSAEANELTGSVRVHYDPQAALDVEALLHAALVRESRLHEALARQTSEPSQPPAGPDSMARLLTRVGADRRELRMATGGSIVVATAAFLPNLAFAAVTNTARDIGSKALTRLGITSIGGQLALLGGLVVASFGLDILLEYQSKRRWLEFAVKLESDVKLAAFDHIQRLDMAYIDEQSTGKLLSIIVEDAAALRKYYEEGYTDIVKKITSGVLINLLLFGVSPALGLLANVSLPLIVGASRHFKPRTASVYQRAGVTRGEFSKALSDNLAGIPTIKSFTNEEVEVERLRELDRRLVDADRRAFEARYAHSGTMRGLFYASWAITVTQASYLVAIERLSRPLYSVVLFSVPQLISSMFGIDETINLHQRANAAAERILAILAVGTEVVDGGDALRGCRGELRFERVDFAYTADKPVLEGLELEFSRGVTAIVGGSGSGKSTIAKLLLRFYDVGRGRVTIDGRDIRELTLRSLRSQIAYVGQDPYLFPGTIEDNIRYGRSGASIEEIRAAAATAEIAEHIESLPDGYQTVIGERGARLSGGQRQRVCIARALLKNAPILIFDEAAASLDNMTEVALQRSISRLAEQRTVILIAHQLASVCNADRIVVLEDGGIKEHGTHEQLLASGGLYASLWCVQANEASRIRNTRKTRSTGSSSPS